MNHSLSAPTSALREFNSLLCAVSTTFFLVFVKFFHRSGEAVFVSAVREATQSSTACQQLFFPLFDFFFHATRCCRREERTYSFPPSLSTTFFSAFEKFFRTFRQPVVTTHSLYLSNSRPGRPLSAYARREMRLWALSRQRSRSFFKFFSKKQNPARGGVMSFPFDARRSGIRSRLRACPGGAAPAFGSAARPTDSSRRWSAARAPCRTHSRRWVGPQARPAPDRCSRRG